MCTQGRILVIKPDYRFTLTLSLPRPMFPHRVSWTINTATAHTEKSGQFRSEREAMQPTKDKYENMSLVINVTEKTTQVNKQ
jgi:hypothetical protein